MARPMDNVTRQGSKPTFRITRFAAPALASLTLLALSACNTASYPSLARREAETHREITKPAAVAQNGSPSAANAARLASLRAQAQAADASFAAARPQAEAALAKAASSLRGDESWSLANLALAQMERARGDLGLALASIEGIYAQDQIAHALDAAPDIAITQTHEAIAAQADSQDRILNALRAKLPR